MTVLVVDYNNESRGLLTTLLEEKGHNVISASNGKTALELIERYSPYIIVTDILMPEMDGFELCRWVRTKQELENTTIVVYTSSYKSPADIELGYALGANEYIFKPQKPDVLLGLIENAIQDHKKYCYPSFNSV